MVPAPSTTTFLGASLRGTPSRGRALLPAVDELLVLVLHDAPLDLEGGRELTRLQAELAGQHHDALDPLELGQVGRQGRDQLPVVGLDLPLACEILAALVGDALLAGPGFQ